MNDPVSPKDGNVDKLCDEFEREWQAGGNPRIEPYLARVSATQQGELLRELLALEVEYRSRRGERPALAEYNARFPAHAAIVLAVFSKPVPAPRSETSGVTELVLMAIEGPHKGQTYTFVDHDIFLAGRSQDATLQVSDDYFSRIHFMVEINFPYCRLTDMKSRNGTLVNGQKVTSADLRDGDRITAGCTTLLVSIRTRQPTAPVPAAPEAATLLLPAGAPPAGTPLPVTVDAPQPVPIPDTIEPKPAAADRVSLSPRDIPSAALTEEEFPRIPGYRLIRELGRGGMGVVYLAEQEKSGLRVALKTIIPAVKANSNQVERFLREADILRQLEHEHIVAFRDSGESDGRLFFAMDYIEGTDAYKMLRQQGPLPVRTAVRLIYQLLKALEYAHAKKFVHRDIKPANILLADEGGGKKSVKLADFGLARVYQASQMSGLTIQGETGGTIAYMPPEQITHFRRVQPPADQYSTAATLYHLLTGTYLFDFGPGGVPPLMMIIHDEPVSICKRRPDLPEELARVVHRALAKRAVDRFPNAGAFRAALTPFAR
jgi:serine/threonine-protein kinase